jgi:hypothetical protein
MSIRGRFDTQAPLSDRYKWVALSNTTLGTLMATLDPLDQRGMALGVNEIAGLVDSSSCSQRPQSWPPSPHSHRSCAEGNTNKTTPNSLARLEGLSTLGVPDQPGLTAFGDGRPCHCFGRRTVTRSRRRRSSGPRDR